MTRPSQILRRVIATVAAVSVATAVASCTSLPDSGPVSSASPQIPEGYGVDVLAQGPPADATAEEIVQGFLRASAYGYADDFDVASQYLASSADWDPTNQTRVFAATTEPVFSTNASGGITVTFSQVGTVDLSGRYSVMSPISSTAQFSLVNENGQWRIAQLSDGLIVSDINFQQTFGAVQLQFLANDRTSLVPELRWYPLDSRLERVVSGLLLGPSDWLDAGVTSAFPAHTQLGPGGVTIADETAIVDLTPQILNLTEDELAYAHQQLVATLSASFGVTNVTITVDGDRVETAANPQDVVDLALPQSVSGPILLSGDVLVRYAGSSIQPVQGAADVSGRSPRDLAIPYEGVAAPIVVVADGGTNLITVPTDGSASSVLLSGTYFAAPSIDRYGWIWTIDSGAQTLIQTLTAGGDSQPISAPWLEGRTPVQIQVAPDGARAIVVSRSGSQSYVEAFSISRDAQGRPTGIGEPIRIAEPLSVVMDLAWIDQVTVAILAAPAPGAAARVYRAPLGGPLTTLPAIDQAVSLAASRGERSIVVVTEDGMLYTRAGATWRPVATGVSDPAFSG